MATFFFCAIVTAFVAFSVWFFWGIRCNRETYLQRGEILAIMKGRADWQLIVSQYEAVSYGQHFDALFWFKDPVALYPPYLRALIRERIEASKLMET